MYDPSCGDYYRRRNPKCCRYGPKNRQVKPLIKFLVELTNDTSTAVYFVGTPLAEELFVAQEHLKRRTRGIRRFLSGRTEPTVSSYGPSGLTNTHHSPLR